MSRRNTLTLVPAWAVVSGSAILTVSCASGGGGAPPTDAEAAALFSSLSGIWTLDESSSSPGTITTTTRVRQTFTVPAGGRPPRGREPDRPLPARQRKLIEAALEIMWSRPKLLQIQVDTAVVNYDHPTGPAVTLVRYGPVSGPSIELQIEGPQLSRRVKEQGVTTRTVWDGGRLGFEHLSDTTGLHDSQQRETAGDEEATGIMVSWLSGPRAPRQPGLQYVKKRNPSPVAGQATIHLRQVRVPHAGG